MFKDHVHINKILKQINSYKETATCMSDVWFNIVTFALILAIESPKFLCS